MNDLETHRDSGAWRKAMDLAAETLGYSGLWRSPEARRLGDRLSDLALALPAPIAQAWHAPDMKADPLPYFDRAETLLLEAETTLLVAVRLRYLTESQAEGALTLVERTRRDLLDMRPAPPAPPSPPPVIVNVTAPPMVLPPAAPPASPAPVTAPVVAVPPMAAPASPAPAASIPAPLAPVAPSSATTPSQVADPFHAVAVPATVKPSPIPVAAPLAAAPPVAPRPVAPAPVKASSAAPPPAAAAAPRPASAPNATSAPRQPVPTAKPAQPIKAPAPVAPPPPAEPPMPVPAPGFDRLVIDGSNFLGRAVGYDLGDPDSREQLLTRLQDHAHAYPAQKVTVFFDGKKAHRRIVGGVEERVTSGQRPADDVLLDYLSQLTAQDRPRCTVVTDDDELAAHARRRGAKVQSVRWLNSRLAPKAPVASTPQPDGSLRRDQLPDWEQFFMDPPKRPGKK